MAHRNRELSILARRLAVAGVATFLASGAAHAQFLGGNLRQANEIAQLLAEAETARLNSDCAGRDAKLAEVVIRLDSALRFQTFSPEGQADFNLRLAEAQARRCPPQLTTPPPPPPVETIPPTGTTLGPPDGSILDAMDDSPAPVGSTSVTPVPVPLSPAQREVMNRVENAFVQAENARSAGNCPQRDIALGNISDAIGVWAGAGLDAGLIENWRARLAAARALPCPPRGVDADRRVGLNIGGDQPARRRSADVSAALSVGYASTQIPVANYGFVADGPPPSPERPAAYSEERPAGFAIEGRLETGRFGSFGLAYARADASNRTEIEAGAAGSRRGYPYSAITLGGSTGISGNVPIEVDTEMQVESYRADWNFRFGADPPAEALEALRTRLNATVGASITYRDRDHLGITSITTPVIATQRLEQEVGELELGLSVGVEAVVPIGAEARLTLGAQAGAYYYDYKLDSLETNTQNFGPAGDRAFTTALDRSVSDIGYRGDAFAELSVDLGPRAELFAIGQAGAFSDRAQVRNPPNGTFVQQGGTSDIGTRHAFDWSMSIGLRIALTQGSMPIH